MSFTLLDLMEAQERMARIKMVVGFTVRPEFKERLLTDPEISQLVLHSGFVGVGVYVVSSQTEPWKAFYSSKELNDYLETHV